MARTVLIVDDDPTVRKLNESLLQKQGHRVLCARDGVEALAMMKNVRPDVIVLDVMMPELNGYDVCNTIKKDPALRDIPVILLTARNQELDPKIAQPMGIEYVYKLSPTSVLLDTVNKLMR